MITYFYLLTCRCSLTYIHDYVPYMLFTYYRTKYILLVLYVRLIFIYKCQVNIHQQVHYCVWCKYM